MCLLDMGSVRKELFWRLNKPRGNKTRQDYTKFAFSENKGSGGEVQSPPLPLVVLAWLKSALRIQWNYAHADPSACVNSSF